MTYYLSLGSPKNFGYYETALLLSRSERFLHACGERVYNPCELFGTDISMTKRWFFGLRYLIASDSVVFPSTWEQNFYSKMDMLICRLLRKNYIVKQFD